MTEKAPTTSRRSGGRFAPRWLHVLAAAALVATTIGLGSAPAAAEAEEPSTAVGVAVVGLGGHKVRSVIATDVETTEETSFSLIGYGCGEAAWGLDLEPGTAVTIRAEFDNGLVLHYDGGGGSTDAALSLPVTVAGEVEHISFDPAPELLLPAPVVSGTASVGQTLVVADGAWKTEWEAIRSWGDVPGAPVLTYQWLRSGQPIPGATASAYTVTAADGGEHVSVRVTGRFWDCLDVAVASAAAPIPAAPGQPPATDGQPPVIGGDDLPATGGEPVAPAADDLVDVNRGGVVVPREVTAGGSVSVSVGADRAGETVHGWLFSTPTALGSAVVAADGTVAFAVPDGVAPGAHRLAVTDAAGQLVGWGEIVVLAADGAAPSRQLAATGSDGILLSLGGGMMLIAGLVLFAVPRVRRASRA
ncbi:hypothetical protein [Microbacterium album]|uniref:Uncharacterized protein n=1 Tax=Microbacterium album TaxID=2053191 RepID=A0A917MKP7_9MICO|nr:hypothetical protein [Microbacterium album]GGH37746.1 hypothetical protein GCM10010921_07890 [Microbacterium album]